MATIWSWRKRHYDVFENDEKTKHDIFHAATIGDCETIKLCLNNNINVNSRDENGWTPLMFCSYNHRIEAMKLIINSGANVNILNDRGETALILVVKTRHKYFTPEAKWLQIDAAKLLLDSNADTHIKDFEGNSVKRWAKHNKLYQVIELLKNKESE